MTLWEKAGDCYQQNGALGDAARCYARAGRFRLAAELYVQAGDVHAAAPMYEQAGDPSQAAWLLVHTAGDVTAARACLARGGTPEPTDTGSGPAWSAASLVHRLAEARCDLEERIREPATLRLLADVQEALAGGHPVNDIRIPDWSTIIAVRLRRLDQAALVHAAAVRGRRSGARQRWITWSAAEFGVPVVLPPDPVAAPARAAERPA
ncbi:hypothetical protein ACFQFC_16255 [Amorphoplanes digitatis]|uniref:Uncharacterized protein n=1 Tax=Actinoplanes digitatis TaxID=1868 RepID=A0A7W7I3G8_9ACTN|nr:hypothetical protein [Actinoplanes digitatis]MBB4765765.1 hypothetical protein [Actinoplanes digitatis]GID93443.1 hypothetical protein Adi01nite_28550 [Actinoplanes digitatis]